MDATYQHRITGNCQCFRGKVPSALAHLELEETWHDLIGKAYRLVHRRQCIWRIPICITALLLIFGVQQTYHALAYDGVFVHTAILWLIIASTSALAFIGTRWYLKCTEVTGKRDLDDQCTLANESQHNAKFSVVAKDNVLVIDAEYWRDDSQQKARLSTTCQSSKSIFNGYDCLCGTKTLPEALIGCGVEKQWQTVTTAVLNELRVRQSLRTNNLWVIIVCFVFAEAIIMSYLRQYPMLQFSIITFFFPSCPIFLPVFVSVAWTLFLLLIAFIVYFNEHHMKQIEAPWHNMGYDVKFNKRALADIVKECNRTQKQVVFSYGPVDTSDEGAGEDLLRRTIRMMIKKEKYWVNVQVLQGGPTEAVSPPLQQAPELTTGQLIV